MFGIRFNSHLTGGRMKKLTLTVVAAICLGLISANALAGCGSCAKDKAKPKCGTTTCQSAKCPMAGLLSKLDLDKDQKAEIGKICKGCSCKGDAPKDKEARKEWAKKRKECMASINKILTPEQRKAWAKLRKEAAKAAKKDKDAAEDEGMVGEDRDLQQVAESIL